MWPCLKLPEVENGRIDSLSLIARIHLNIVAVLTTIIDLSSLTLLILTQKHFLYAVF